MNTIQLFDYKITETDINLIKQSNSKTIINTINPHSYCVAKNNSEFKQHYKVRVCFQPMALEFFEKRLKDILSDCFGK